MERNDLVPAIECCNNYNLVYSFITWLNEHELLEIHVIEEQEFIPQHQLGNLEQFMRLHYELDINLEGIEAISHLLKRVEMMQEEMNQLKNKVRIFEMEINNYSHVG